MMYNSNYSNILLIPVQTNEISQKITEKVLETSLPKDPNEIMIVGKHESDMKNIILSQEFPKKNITYRELSNVNITENMEMLEDYKNFLGKNEKKNVIIFSLDLSDKDNTTTSVVLEDEKELIKTILSKNQNYTSIYGIYNIDIFIRLCSLMNSYPEIVDYNNSVNMKKYWTKQEKSNIVSYLGMKANSDQIDTYRKNIGFYFQFLCSYSRSLLLNNDITLPDYEVEINNPIFITISFLDKTIGCIGSYAEQKSIEDKVKHLSTTIIEDSKERWKNAITKDMIQNLKQLNNNDKNIFLQKLKTEVVFPEMIQNSNFNVKLSVLEYPLKWKIVEGLPEKNDSIGYAIDNKKVNQTEFRENPHWRGIFLPSVWKENSYSPEQYVQHLKGKGQFVGNNYTIFSFQCIVFEEKQFISENTYELILNIIEIPVHQSINKIQRQLSDVQRQAQQASQARQ